MTYRIIGDTTLGADTRSRNVLLVTNAIGPTSAAPTVITVKVLRLTVYVACCLTSNMKGSAVHICRTTVTDCVAASTAGCTYAGCRYVVRCACVTTLAPVRGAVKTI